MITISATSQIYWEEKHTEIDSNHVLLIFFHHKKPKLGIYWLNISTRQNPNLSKWLIWFHYTKPKLEFNITWEIGDTLIVVPNIICQMPHLYTKKTRERLISFIPTWNCWELVDMGSSTNFCLLLVREDSRHIF
jgi:hypothetical protein